MNATLKVQNETFMHEGLSYKGALFTITMKDACV
jgi:hypothetical protein